MKGKLKHIPKTRDAHISGGRYSIKRILYEEGYNDAEIAEMLKENRILISRPNLRQGIRTHEKLYILEVDSSTKTDKYATEVDRFRELDLE